MGNEMKNLPKEIFRAAVWQWFGVGSIMLVMWILTYFPMGILVALLSRPMTNKHGESEAEHDPRYITEGSSGKWYFYSTDIPIVNWWANVEDGQLGEPSGKWSASQKGKENTFWAKYAWARRNPFNKFKRESDFFACFVNDCEIVYWGDKVVSDKTLDGDGVYFIMATNRITGKKYYGYRKVVHFDKLDWYVKLKGIVGKIPYFKKFVPIMDNRIYQPTFGFKIKPTHATEVQDADDLDKAFTARIQFWGKVN